VAVKLDSEGEEPIEARLPGVAELRSKYGNLEVLNDPLVIKS